MAGWARAAVSREQLVLFPTRLDEIIAPDHVVRLLDDLLSQIDWTPWERRYNLQVGQPPIHPAVLAKVVLYGLLTRTRSSRALEEALGVRNDFRWLAEGRCIDHSTLSEFRRTRRDELKDLFVQIGLLARKMGWLPLEKLAFDGTRIRANNRRSGTRTPGELQKMEQELAEKYVQLQAQLDATDAGDEEVLGAESSHALSAELADVESRRRQVNAALAELKRVQEAGETVPSRIPLTDPQSRMTPNKAGGFAPNYTPLATVDVTTGLVVDADVVAETDEARHLIGAVDNVRQQFAVERTPDTLADGMMATGENLKEYSDRGATLYSPIAGSPPDNPARRDDPSQPVPEDQWDRLPVKGKNKQLDKSAFVYDAGRDAYWCPQGKPLDFANSTSETENGRRRVRRRYFADKESCAACPLRASCLSGKAQRRQISREQHEEFREAQAQRMATAAAQDIYRQRRHPGERPFAIAKQHFGVRQFLLRGLDKVRTEWRWVMSAFNLHRLIGLIRSGAGPPARLAPS